MTGDREIVWDVALNVEQLRKMKSEGWHGPDEKSLRGRAAACWRYAEVSHG